jgi:trehalose-phosphatase
LSLPHAATILPLVLANRHRAGRLLVGLDYDGTLTPIVERPEDARLDESARATLSALAARPDTSVAILSGRAMADLQERVRVPGLYYAGNHGLEIDGPQLRRVHEGAVAALPALQAAAEELRVRLASVGGAQVEEKGSTVSVHYRRVSAHERAAVRDVALRSARERAGIRATEGKMVVELRPDVDWHKGSALEFIRRSLAGGPGGPALFVGDDRTDEDAFRSLGPDGWGVVVAPSPPAVTAARAFLASTEEVVAFLRGLLADTAA